MYHNIQKKGSFIIFNHLSIFCHLNTFKNRKGTFHSLSLLRLKAVIWFGLEMLIQWQT